MASIIPEGRGAKGGGDKAGLGGQGGGCGRRAGQREVFVLPFFACGDGELCYFYFWTAVFRFEYSFGGEREAAHFWEGMFRFVLHGKCSTFLR